MPLGSFRLNSLAKKLAAAGGGGGPAIPTTTWTVTGNITSTFGNTQSSRAHVALGYNNGRYFSAGFTSSTSASSPRLRIGSSSGGLGSTSVSAGFSPDTYVSTGVFNFNNNGGNWVGMMASSSSVRFQGASQAGWLANTAVATTNPTAGTLGSTFSRTSGTNDSISITNSKYPTGGQGYLRVIGAWQSGSNIVGAAYTLTSGSGSMTSRWTDSTIITGGVNGAFMGTAGFTKDDLNVAQWAVAYVNSSGRYQVQMVRSSTSPLIHTVTDLGMSIDYSVTDAGLATMWDDATTSTFICCAMVTSGSTIYVRPAKLNFDSASYTWATNTTTALSTSGFKPKIIQVQGTNGLCLLTYLKASSSNTLYGKWISVDPTTLAVTVGSEFTIGVAPDSLNINHYGLSCYHDATYKFIGGCWAATSGGDGGPFNISGS
jgi:hypothetical protein